MTALEGSQALQMPGKAMMLTTPIAPMTRNQTSITGPKARPMAWVPKRWTRKSTTRKAIEMGTTFSETEGFAMAMPWTAETIWHNRGGSDLRRSSDQAREAGRARSQRWPASGLHPT